MITDGRFETISRGAPGGGYEWNWKGPDGKLVFKGEWSDSPNDFLGGWGRITRKGGGKVNFVDTEGRLLSDVWFDDATTFGANGSGTYPALAKLGKKWYALYGRTPDGKPDLSKKSVEASFVHQFSCGVAVVGKSSKDATNYGYVDRNMEWVGPKNFMFGIGYDFDPYGMGGKWTYVNGRGVTLRSTLMNLDGTLMFAPGKPSDEWPTYLHADNFPDRAIAGWSGKNYVFEVSSDWSSAPPVGYCETMTEIADAADGRLGLCQVRDRMDGRESMGFAAYDSGGKMHFICSLDGRAAGSI